VALSIGVTVFTSIAIYTYSELTVDHCYKDYQQIYRLYNAETDICELDYELKPLLENFKEINIHCPVIRAEWPLVVKSESKTIKFNQVISTNDRFFELFGIKVISSIDKKLFAEQNAVILPEATAKKIFGNDNPLGQMLNIENQFNLKVTAVVSNLPENSSLKADLYINAEPEDLRIWWVCDNGECYYPMNHFVKLVEGTQVDTFVNELNKYLPEHQNRVKSFGAEPLKNIYLGKLKEGNSNLHGNPVFLKVLALIGLVVLILSVINYLNYSLSQQMGHIKDLSIKKINGAGFRQLIKYSLAENFSLLVVVLFISLACTFLIKDLLAQLLGKPLDFNLLKSPMFLGIYFLIIALVFAVNNLIPLLTSLKIKALSGLNNQIQFKGKKQVRSVFTIIQYTTAIVLLTAVFFISRQIEYIDSFKVGFNKNHLVRISIPFENDQTQALKSEIDKLNFVESTSFTSGFLGNVSMDMGSNLEDNDFYVRCIKVDSNFIKTFRIELLDGRNFLGGDMDKACLMNETAYKKFGWENLENRIFDNGREGGYQVIGITNDFIIETLHRPQLPVCMMFTNDLSPEHLNIKLNSGNIKEQIAQIETVFEEVLPNDIFELTFYDTYFNQLYSQEKRLSKLILILAFLAICLSSLGLISQVMELNALKTKEIGIRKVNGARTFQILLMLNINFIKWVAIAFVIAVPISYYVMNKWLENFAYKTTLTWWIFALAGLLALVIALVTVSWQSYRTARRNPIESLRYE
jgi:putative ABC transport system permease protein